MGYRRHHLRHAKKKRQSKKEGHKKEHAGKGRKMEFYGAFKSKEDAVKREKEHKGAFIVAAT